MKKLESSTGYLKSLVAVYDEYPIYNHPIYVPDGAENNYAEATKKEYEAWVNGEPVSPASPTDEAFQSIGYDSIPDGFNNAIEHAKERASKWNPHDSFAEYYIFRADWQLVFAPKIDTSTLNTMSEMFSGCGALTSIPVFNTSNVTNMSKMFSYCHALTSVPLFDTSKVTNMNYMFRECDALISVPLFNTPYVTDMSYMFTGCSRLKSVPLFNTSRVINMREMFSYCSALTSIPLFDTSNVTNMKGMFYDCRALTSVPAFNTSKVTDMSMMFYSSYSSNLTSIPAFNTSNVVSMDGMFYNCTSLISILMTGTKCSFDISDTKLEHDALVVLLNNLGTANSGATLTMGNTKLALLSDAEKKIALDKGWTLA